MLEWPAELVFAPTTSKVERCVLKLECVCVCSRCTHDIDANSRETPLEAWRRLLTRYDPTSVGRNRKLLRTIVVLGDVLCWSFKLVSNDTNPTRCFVRKLEDTLGDVSKLGGLEALAHDELENLLIFNSNRLRTFEVSRLEIVAYVEAKFGMRTRDSKPSDSGARGHSDTVDVDAINLAQESEHDHRVHETVVSSAVETYVPRNCSTSLHPRNCECKCGKQLK